MVKLKRLDRDIRKRLLNLGSKVSDLKGVSFIYLFGSYARGDENNLSDIDVAYYLSDNLKNKEKIETELYDRISSYLRTDEITFVCLNNAPLYLSHRIVIEGVVLYERDKDERINFVEKINKLYLDFLPVYKEVYHGY